MSSARGRSESWKFYDRNNDGTATCRICSKKIKTCGNTSNLTCHLRRIHLLSVVSSPTTNESSQDNSPDASGNACQATSAPSPDDLSDSVHVPIKQRRITDCITNMNSYAIENGKRSQKITNSLIHMICVDNEPLSIVNRKGFQQLMHTAVPLYRLPGKNTISKMIDDKYESVKKAFLEKLAVIEHICLTTDVWTDRMQCRSFLGITAHFSDETKLCSINIGVYQLSERHNAEYLANKLTEICNIWNINKEAVTAIVTDNAANIVKAVELAFGKRKHIPCFAHTLNLVVEKAVESVPDLEALFGKVKSIVTWFKQSVVASDELRKSTTSETKLVQEVPTRWNSKYYMIQRFVELRAVINDIVNRHPTAPAMVSAREILELTEIMDILQPLEAATKELSGENYVTSSVVIPMVHSIIEKVRAVQPKEPMANALKHAVLDQCTKRFGLVEQVHLLAMATLLDPRFKKIYFKDHLLLSKEIRSLKEMVKKMKHIADMTDEAEEVRIPESQHKNSTFSLWSNHQQLVSENRERANMAPNDAISDEVLQYVHSPVGSLHEKPLEMWKELAYMYPSLGKIAKKYLTIMATSVPSERLFSKAGLKLTQQRSRLKGDRLSKLIFLQSLDDSFWQLG